MSLSHIIKTFPKNENIVSVSSFSTPIGNIYAAADDNFIYIVIFEDSKGAKKMFESLAEKLACEFLQNKNNVLKKLEGEIEAYFAGSLKKFSVPIKSFGSDFQQMVWDKLQQLPYGETLSYGDLAKVLGKSPSHARAIGAACGANPHVLIVPCHRIVSSSSKGGFSCGLDRKEWLLEHEKKYSE